MELGPLQKKWVQYLKDNPTLQGSGYLGIFEEDKPKELCCLGAYLICYNASKNVSNKIVNGNLVDDYDNSGLSVSYDELGLLDAVGAFVFFDNETFHQDMEGVDFGKNNNRDLASANDGGVTWLEIAEFIEQQPEKVFTKSV